jgi:hypothetical protein
MLRIALALALVPFAAGARPAVHDTVWFHGAQPAPGLRITEDVAGHCVGGARSTARPDAWRCFADEHWIDPCFSATSTSRTVLCPLDPWSQNVRLVELTRRLPQVTKRRLPRNRPWAVWTANAKQCVISVSNSGLRLAGQLVRYECAGSGFLVGFADIRDGAWTIGYVPRYDLGNPHLHPRRIGITDVWR